MNCTGTERQRAVLGAFKAKPESSHKELAAVAGVSKPYVGLVLRAHDHEKEEQQQRARDEWAISLKAPELLKIACTEHQHAVAIAISETERLRDESKRAYCRRVAKTAHCSPQLVQGLLEIARCARIGAELRAKEAEEAKNKLVPLSLNAGAVQLPDFKGWADVFHRVKLLSEAYLRIAMSRGDVYAQSFLKTLAENAERGEERAWLDKSSS
jgi:hypothetical protein